MKAVAKALTSAALSCVERMRSFAASATTRGVFVIECYGSDGTLRWREVAKNGTCNSGLDSMLNVYFRGTTQITSWYLGLIDNSGYTALAAADTMASHSGWSESTAYSESTRPAWSPAASSGQTVTNSSTVNFTANATATIRGVFCTSANDKGGSTGTLYSTAAFSGGNQTLGSGDVLKVTYSSSLVAG